MYYPLATRPPASAACPAGRAGPTASTRPRRHHGDLYEPGVSVELRCASCTAPVPRVAGCDGQRQCSVVPPPSCSAAGSMRHREPSDSAQTSTKNAAVSDRNNRL